MLFAFIDYLQNNLVALIKTLNGLQIFVNSEKVQCYNEK